MAPRGLLERKDQPVDPSVAHRVRAGLATSIASAHRALMCSELAEAVTSPGMRATRRRLLTNAPRGRALPHAHALLPPTDDRASSRLVGSPHYRGNVLSWRNAVRSIEAVERPSMSIAGDIRAAYAHLRTSGGFNVKTVLEHGPSYLAARLREGREGFDRKHRTETSMVVGPGLLGLTGPNAHDSALYWPTLHSVFVAMMSQLRIRHQDFVFIDVGSGKGRAVLMAAEYPFKRIVGIELSPILHAIAERNLSRYEGETQRCRAVELRCMDATELAFPPETTVVYLFNPFKSERVMMALLSRVNESLARHPRDLFIVYQNPRLDESVRSMGFRTIRAVKRWGVAGFGWTIYEPIRNS